MYTEYRDLILRIPERPVWWKYGIPRYDPFHPNDMYLYDFEVALVHIECQDCGMRYDVGISATVDQKSIRDRIAFINDLGIGDPPYGCDLLSACSAGRCMNSMEVEVLEYWVRKRTWQRDTTFERRLLDWNWRGDKSSDPPPSVWSRIRNSSREPEWSRAEKEGDFEAMVALLSEFGCERPKHVANMLDNDRRRDVFRRQLFELAKARFADDTVE